MAKRKRIFRVISNRAVVVYPKHLYTGKKIFCDANPYRYYIRSKAESIYYNNKKLCNANIELLNQVKCLTEECDDLRRQLLFSNRGSCNCAQATQPSIERLQLLAIQFQQEVDRLSRAASSSAGSQTDSDEVTVLDLNNQSTAKMSQEEREMVRQEAIMRKAMKNQALFNLTPIQELSMTTEASNKSTRTRATFTPKDTSSRASATPVSKRDEVFASFRGTPLFVDDDSAAEDSTLEDEEARVECEQMLQDFNQAISESDTVTVVEASLGSVNPSTPYRPSFLGRDSYLAQIEATGSKQPLTETQRFNNGMTSPMSSIRPLHSTVAGECSLPRLSEYQKCIDEAGSTCVIYETMLNADEKTDDEVEPPKKKGKRVAPRSRSGTNRSKRSTNTLSLESTLKDTSEPTLQMDLTLDQDSADLTDDSQPGRRRRKAVSYKEPKLAGKIRAGDPNWCKK